MCGYSGVLLGHEFYLGNHLDKQRDALRAGFLAAAKQVAHRGNDDARVTYTEGLWLSHYRLAFQDVSHSHQPQFSADGQWAIVFNGEIYNHFALRSSITERTGHAFNTRGDTETILAGFLAFGPHIADLLEGEFSFVIARNDGSKLFAARDACGVKPLFFGLEGVDTEQFACAQHTYEFQTKALSFASEMKALPLEKRWQRDGLLRQFVGLFEPVRTPFEHIIQCPPGGRFEATRASESESAKGGFLCTLTLSPTPVRARASLFSAPRTASVPEQETAGNGLLDWNDLRTRFADTLQRSVVNRLLSDVELGVYLSGGIDSKAIAFELHRSLATNRALQGTKATASGHPKTFTIGFRQAEYDETAEATKFARYLGFDPKVAWVDNKALHYAYAHAVWASENVQPYTNGAAKWWLSLFTRKHVRGVLTGDGADELLCGYPSFRYAAWWKFAARARTPMNTPNPFDTDKGTSSQISVAQILAGFAQKPLGSHWRDGVYARKFNAHAKDPWLAGSSSEGLGFDFCQSLEVWGLAHPLFGQVKAIAEACLGASEAHLWLARQRESLQSWFAWGYGCEGTAARETFLASPENALLAWQNYFSKTHLPVQILNWVGDRMEMANTLEGRTPFLSREMRTLVHDLPDVALVAGLQDKAILRRTYAQLFPREFAYTPKRQFNAPLLDDEKLLATYDTARVFEKAGIGDKTTFARMQKTMQELAGKTDAHSTFTRAHTGSALQTMICMSIVQRTLIEGQAPQRDQAYEDQVLSDSK